MRDYDIYPSKHSEHKDRRDNPYFNDSGIPVYDDYSEESKPDKFNTDLGDYQ